MRNSPVLLSGWLACLLILGANCGVPGAAGPADMFVPLLLGGPGVPQGRLDAARTVDVMPTVLKLLGRKVPAGLDGQPIVP